MEDFFRVILADASNQFIVNLQIMCVWAFNILPKIQTRYLFGRNHVADFSHYKQAEIQMFTTVLDIEKFSRYLFFFFAFYFSCTTFYSIVLNDFYFRRGFET